MTEKQTGSSVVPMDRELVMKTLAELEPRLFDGHTEFSSLTAEQRLIWISQIAWFVYEFCGIALRSGL